MAWKIGYRSPDGLSAEQTVDVRSTWEAVAQVKKQHPDVVVLYIKAALLVAQYRLVFDGLDTARIKPADDPTSAPLAWFRLSWRPGTNEVAAVNVYGHAEHVSDRPWLSTCATIRDAVTYCDTLVPGTPVEADYDWSGGTLEEN